MARTNAQIDALNLMRDPESPILPYETEDGTVTLTDEQIAENEKIKAGSEAKKSEEEKKIEKVPSQEEIDAKKKEDEEPGKLKVAVEAEAEKIKLENEEKSKKEKEKVEEPELDDEKILAYLKAKKGKEVTSLDELLNPKKELTPEEKEKAAEQREANKVAYGLSKGLFTNKQFESYITDSKNPIPLVLEAYIKDQQEKDPALTETEIEDEFNERFGLNEEKDSRVYKTGQKLISNIASNLINQKYSSIVNLEKDYSSFEESQKKSEEYENKLKSQTPVYKKDIEQVKKEIKKVSIPVLGSDDFETELDDEIINEIISQMIEPSYSKEQIQKGWDKDNIKQTAQTAAIIKSLPSLMKNYADKMILAQQAGVRGIKPQPKEGEKNAKTIELSENQKKAIAMMADVVAN